MTSLIMWGMTIPITLQERLRHITESRRKLTETGKDNAEKIVCKTLF